MSTFYKIFLIVFIVLVATNIYAMKWNLGYDHPDNNVSLIAIGAGILGILGVVIMNTWRKLKPKA